MGVELIKQFIPFGVIVHGEETIGKVKTGPVIPKNQTWRYIV